MLCDSALCCLVTKGMECNKYCGSGVPLSEVTPVEMELGSRGIELHTTILHLWNSMCGALHLHTQYDYC